MPKDFARLCMKRRDAIALRHKYFVGIENQVGWANTVQSPVQSDAPKNAICLVITNNSMTFEMINRFLRGFLARGFLLCHGSCSGCNRHEVRNHKDYGERKESFH